MTSLVQKKFGDAAADYAASAVHAKGESLDRLIIARHLLNKLRRPGHETEVADALRGALSQEGLRSSNLSHALATYARLVDDYKRKIAALGEQPEETGFSEFVEIADLLKHVEASVAHKHA